uniref:Uncharacterized protein n=1 Tax=Ciona savignyi TaxID=51511 RepID=H2Y9L0_CIOSA
MASKHSSASSQVSKSALSTNPGAHVQLKPSKVSTQPSLQPPLST